MWLFPQLFRVVSTLFFGVIVSFPLFSIEYERNKCSSLNLCWTKAKETPFIPKKLLFLKQGWEEIKDKPLESETFFFRMDFAEFLLRDGSGAVGWETSIPFHIHRTEKYQKEQYQKARDVLETLNPGFPGLTDQQRTRLEKLIEISKMH